MTTPSHRCCTKLFVSARAARCACNLSEQAGVPGERGESALGDRRLQLVLRF